MHTLVNYLKFTLLAAPLLAACGGGVNNGGVVIPAGGLTFPDCNDGELIGVGADKTLACLPAPTGKLSPPSCLADQVLTSEGGVLKCATKGNGMVDTTVQARLTNVESQINQINNTVMSLKAGGGGRARWLGPAGMSNGQINSGNLRGITGAAEVCRLRYTMNKGAHMCTVPEMFEAVATGQITDQTTGVDNLWVYMVGWSTPVAAPQEPLNGMNDNCASYTYPTGDLRWTGTTVSWSNTTLGNRSLKFNSSIACNQTRAIACCE